MKVAIKDVSANVTKLIMDDIEVPSFYKDVADVASIGFYHGANFVDKPHYMKEEQIVCAVDGSVSMTLIPHVHRQEVYTGDLKQSVFWDPLVMKARS